jgi:hypothetical protein
LDIGPTAEGEIIQAEQDGLFQAGAWLKAIGAMRLRYGRHLSLLPFSFHYGSCSALTSSSGSKYLKTFLSDHKRTDVDVLSNEPKYVLHRHLSHSVKWYGGHKQTVVDS